LRLLGVEFDACWEMLGLGERPPTVALPSPGRTLAERRRLLDSVLDALRRRGLADGSGLDRRVAGLLRLLAHPDYQLDLRLFSHSAGSLVAIGAVAGGYGVLLSQQADHISIRPARPAQMVIEVVGLVGPMAAAVGRTVNLPAEIFDTARQMAADGTLWTMADHLVELGIPRLDASSCVHMCTGALTYGQLALCSIPTVPRASAHVDRLPSKRRRLFLTTPQARTRGEHGHGLSTGCLTTGTAGGRTTRRGEWRPG
jgi:EspG family